MWQSTARTRKTSMTMEMISPTIKAQVRHTMKRIGNHSYSRKGPGPTSVVRECRDIRTRCCRLVPVRSAGLRDGDRLRSGGVGDAVVSDRNLCLARCLPASRYSSRKGTVRERVCSLARVSNSLLGRSSDPCAHNRIDCRDPRSRIAMGRSERGVLSDPSYGSNQWSARRILYQLQ